MKIIDYQNTGVATIIEPDGDDPAPKGIYIAEIDVIVTRAFLDKWSGHFQREDEFGKMLDGLSANRD